MRRGSFLVVRFAVPVDHLASGGVKMPKTVGAVGGLRLPEWSQNITQVQEGEIRLYLSCLANSARTYGSGMLMWPFLEKTSCSKKFSPPRCHQHPVSAEEPWKVSPAGSGVQVNN